MHIFVFVHVLECLIFMQFGACVVGGGALSMCARVRGCVLCACRSMCCTRVGGCVLCACRSVCLLYVCSSMGFSAGFSVS